MQWELGLMAEGDD